MKENKRIAITKLLLKNSLIELMSKKEIDKISVSELCSNAGVNRTTFYNHYYRPNDVLNEIEENVINDLQKILNGENLNNSERQLSKKVELVCDYLLKNKEISKLIFESNSTYSNFSKKLLKIPESSTLYYNYANMNLDENAKELITSFMQNGMYSLIKLWLTSDMKKTPTEVGELVESIVISK